METNGFICVAKLALLVFKTSFVFSQSQLVEIKGREANHKESVILERRCFESVMQYVNFFSCNTFTGFQSTGNFCEKLISLVKNVILVLGKDGNFRCLIVQK